MRAKLGVTLVYFEKAAAIVAIVVPALGGIASILNVSLTETK